MVQSKMAKEKECKKPGKKLDEKTKKLQEQLGSLEKEKTELFKKLQRVSADYANYQKRGEIVAYYNTIPRVFARLVDDARSSLRSFLPESESGG